MSITSLQGRCRFLGQGRAFEEVPLHSPCEEGFVVFVRDLLGQEPERTLVACPSYEEAVWVRDECASPTRRCIIRYVGPVGGGD